MRISILSLCLLSACFFNANHEDGIDYDPDGTKTPSVHFNAYETLKLRPGTCAPLAVIVTAVENPAVEITIDGPGTLFDAMPGSGARDFQLCTSLKMGSGGYIYAKVQGTALSAKLGYTLVLPYESDAPRVAEPLKMFGRTAYIPTSVQWSDDGTTIYIAYYDFSTQKSYLQAWDAATVAPKRNWVGLGPHVRVIGSNRAVTDGDAAYVFDLEHNRSLTWLPGPTLLGFQGGGDPTVPSVAQVRGVAGFNDLIAVGSRFSTNSTGNCFIASVDLSKPETIQQTMASVGDSGAYYPLTAYMMMSPNGRFLAWGGNVSCGSDVDPNALFTQMYDFQTRKRFNCGIPNTGMYPINTTSTMFSNDGRVFAYTDGPKVFVQSLPGCTEIGTGYDGFSNHSQVAVSPDGSHLAFINSLGSFDEVRHIDISPGSSAFHTRDGDGATLTLGSAYQWKLPPTQGPYIQKFHHALAYSPDGKRIAIAQLGGRVHIVDALSGTTRSDNQGPLYYDNPGSRLQPSLSPDGNFLSEGDAVTSLDDGHVVYSAGASEIIVEARDDGFVIQVGSPASYQLVNYFATSVRTTISNYMPATVDRSSPNLHRTCGLNVEGKVCIYDKDGTVFSCGAKPPRGIDPSGILRWVMTGDASCAYSSGGYLYSYRDAQHATTLIAPDPTRGRLSSESILFPYGHEMFPSRFVSVGGTIAIWPIQ